jgi:hypothetical protein
MKTFVSIAVVIPGRRPKMAARIHFDAGERMRSPFAQACLS